ncbi:HEAT-INDUCIBLE TRANSCRIPTION REPRESSOR [Mycoplasmopsis pulmonis]|uniref:Heat-inducible transcription repressor HrcA n=1 Tax=Mycoplasmopsis pulmonis (strain UAB CTIP) TaxID=272635 RepID=HRCA_MYCPU|nr:heat-inducible transcriptional repressor HrcA [Mycoplasmopsis pulmonis]Q98R68.1 RecName: Full=Heat-inducible transcription repressor HrcA [Mycoplasmopsis pulmonis UAB CTIP]CAC13315.1 HEAT-INDUCIBLE TRANSCRIPTION REPRESSOR [Mycoplasmopsis pulmonis]VEU67906.1 heat inducible transcription repressor HrcA [Mycoplasmopsis pulmonis]
MNFENKEIKLETKKTILFKNIVELYLRTGKPIGSKFLVEQDYGLGKSSATIRNMMHEFEEIGLLEKSHISSGRIPSTLGLKYYVKYLANSEDSDLKKQLKKLFFQRKLTIDETIELAAKSISEIVGLTMVTSTENSFETLKSIQLVLLDKNESIIIIVLSSGKVISKKLAMKDSIVLDDLRIAVRIFKERLIDTKVSELHEKTLALKPILKISIQNYEDILQEFIINIFDFEVSQTNNVYGKKNIILARDIKREDLTKIIKLIESTSIWQTIEDNLEEEENIKIEIRPDNSSFLSKKISIDNKIREISVVGSKKMDYAKAKSALMLIEDLVEENKKKEKGNNEDNEE